MEAKKLGTKVPHLTQTHFCNLFYMIKIIIVLARNCSDSGTYISVKIHTPYLTTVYFLHIAVLSTVAFSSLVI